MKIAIAAVLGIMLFKLWPAANHYMKHGPKGTAKDWKAAIVPLAMVVGFVVLLIMMVR